MKNLLKLVLILGFAVPAWATQYYLSTTGNDSHAGTSTGTAWLTPNHSLNCGDTIFAVTGTYLAASSFNYGSWGTVTGSGHCVAFIQCQTFAGCLVNNASASPLMFITSSHWGISGFVFTQNITSNNYACIQTGVNNLTDFIVFNNVFNGCYGGSMQFSGADYIVEIANIAYNAAQESTQCASGFPVNAPINFDNAPGTHVYLAQNFGWGNADPNPCGGTTPTDGEGIIFDSWASNSFTGQGAAENNLMIYNASSGIQVWTNGTAHIYLKNNTSFANNASNVRSTALCGEFAVASTSGATSYVESSANIAKTNVATSCNGNALYGLLAWSNNATDPLYSSFSYSAAGHNQTCTGTCTGFAPGPGNTLGTDPVFSNAPSSTPAAPNCGSSTSVINCMAPLITEMTATAAGTSGLGYQPVSATPIFDPLYPSWLSQYSSQLAGLVTQGTILGSVLR